MNNHFTITIHDDNGVRQFNMHQFAKKAMIYIVAFFGVIGLSGVATIMYLNSNVSKIEGNIKQVKNAYSELKRKNDNLNKSMEETQSALLDKRDQLEELSSSLSEIELLIGLSPDETKPIEERVNLTKLTSNHMTTLLQFIPNGSPIKYEGMTSKFGYRIHPTLHRREMHKGCDLRAKMNTAVYATADGRVEWAGYHKSSGYGRLVILDHNYGFRTYFGHLNKIVVKSNTFVKKGDLIAYTGNSGMSSGPHLHYGIKFSNRPVNPYWFIKWTVKNYKEIFEKEKKIPWQSLVKATTHIQVPKPTKTLPLSLREHQLTER